MVVNSWLKLVTATKGQDQMESHAALEGILGRGLVVDPVFKSASATSRLQQKIVMSGVELLHVTGAGARQMVTYICFPP